MRKVQRPSDVQNSSPTLGGNRTCQETESAIDVQLRPLAQKTLDRSQRDSLYGFAMVVSVMMAIAWSVIPGLLMVGLLLPSSIRIATKLPIPRLGALAIACGMAYSIPWPLWLAIVAMAATKYVYGIGHCPTYPIESAL